MCFFVLCDICRAPFSWNRTGGVIAPLSSELGISKLRGDWFVKWTTEIANSTCVNMSQYEEGLGRIMFVAGALEYEKLFLGPLCRFLSLHPGGSIRRVPPYVSFILSYLANQIAHCRHFPTITSIEIAPRQDLSSIVFQHSGRFSHEITEREFPWVFERGGKPSLLTSSLSLWRSSSR